MKPPPLDLDFAAGRDEAPAIACDGERLSYADLRRRAAAITARLGSLGLRRGERFGALLANGPNVIAFHMACARTEAAGQAAVLADILAVCRAALAELPRTRFGKFDKAAAARQLD